MTATPFRRDQHSATTEQRRLALSDAIDHCRRAASATAAAGAGEPNALKSAVLDSIHDRLQSLLTQLQALE